MDALPFLSKKPAAPSPFYVVVGDEAYLKRRVIRRLIDLAMDGEDSGDSVTVHAGDKAVFSTVFDELETMPFFSAKRIVVIDAADPFVTKHRTALEKKVEAAAFPSTGLFILDVKTWPANTRLAKMVDASQTITCKAPAPFKMPQWASEWAASQHQKKLPLAAAQLLVELVGGAEMGLVDQELSKLATYVGDRDTITLEDVDKLVGNSRSENTWKIFDLIGQGQAAPALRLLQRVLEQGDEPMRIVGAFSMQLRKLAQAARLSVTHSVPLGAALQQSGIPPFALQSAEAQLRHLSRARALKLYDSLLQLNLDLRGNSPLDETIVLERYLLTLARK